ncbi:hypothetical protein D8890_09340 [Streptococcus sanguinis]|uniref:DUF1310 family protein n=1 Tax=Streptococcus sanguinis TaxID=1305 RepID=UPI000F65EE30|nr:DUF1310 family protein [Streptococcus sanguinis]RSI03322.1 hypothetical protein D8890_09340 [Streptococcus sanguinis]
MKKIFVIFLSIITLSSAMFLGGCSMPSSRSEKEEMIQIAESTKMKKAIEKELRELDPKALTPEGKIKTYKIEKNKLDFNPMGGLDIYLIINDDKKFELDMTFQENSTTGEYETGGYGMSPEFKELIRGEK